MTFPDGDAPMRFTSHDRSGMSLTELLVVIAILGLLAITVVPAFGTSAELRRTRGASRAVSSVMAKAQARSIGRPTWSGFRILPMSSGSGADRVVVVDSHPPYRGDTATAAVTVAAGATGTGTATPVVAGDFAWLSSLAITANDVIRFDGRGPAFRITSANALPILFALRGPSGGEDVGQSQLNTPWPSAGPHTVEIFRQPMPAGTPFVIPENRVIDLRWSRYGAGGSFNADDTVTVLFDSSGRMRQISAVAVTGSQTTITASMPLFLLVGRADRAGRNEQLPLDPNDDTLGANWQYADSWWLAIDPGAGIVKAAECNATADTLIDSQRFIRQTLTDSADGKK